ncbi:MAG: helix-turn-helix domain-containing protein [Acidobacteriota bacterium]
MERLPFKDPLLENKDLHQQLRLMVDHLVKLGITLREAQQEIEKLFIERTLVSCNGNRSRAAKQLGMHRNTLNSRIERYDLNHRETGRDGSS